MDLDPTTDLQLERVLDAPRALVWECWTRPEHVRHFFVPRPHAVTACEIDLRVGGRFDTTFRVEGQEMVNRGVFLEVVPEERLVFTDGYSEGWKPAPDPFMTAILMLGDAGAGRTAYHVVVRHRSAEARERHEAMGFHEGWGIVAQQLEDYAKGLGR